jgi:hypothetical protein
MTGSPVTRLFVPSLEGCKCVCACFENDFCLRKGLFEVFPCVDAVVVKSTQLSYLSKCIDVVIESYSSKNESYRVKYNLSKSLKVFGSKYT